jgi:type 1 fimbriae regulatory protein FimB/type 1 fimbriae regulatory protein FimE
MKLKKNTPSSGKQVPVPPKRVHNKLLRDREHLTPQEVELVIETSRGLGRYGYRDATMILLAYRHGLRISELLALQWSQVDLREGHMHVKRRKNGISTTHPLFGPEIRSLRKIQRDYPETQYVFVTERKGPMTDSTFRKIVSRAGKKAGLQFPIHPHMLRHSTGFKLANEGTDTRSIQHYLGHKNIQHTVRYTEIVPSRFKDFWND